MTDLRTAATRLAGTVTFRLALGYGVLAVGSLVLISILFYFGTVGVLAHGIDAKLRSRSDRLAGRFAEQGVAGVESEIRRLLEDGVDSDTEVYLVETPAGQGLVGNLTAWPAATTPFDRLTDQDVVRAGRPSVSRLLPRRLPDGNVLVVGRDMQDLTEIRQLVWRALGTGGAFAVQLAIGGAFLFRRQVERRIATIRQTARKIETGNLGLRIPVSGLPDEFSRLAQDINHMLDWIQSLMDGVQHVSNAIAHDLRTPLGRIRGQLDEALRPGNSEEHLAKAASSAIGAIDDLTIVFDKLLQIAEAESGTRRRSFERVALRPIVTDVAELYDAMAEDKGITLISAVEDEPATFGDRDLLASAVANLVENALKYAGKGATVRLRAATCAGRVLVDVQDDGPGVPAELRPKLAERFFRVDSSRNEPGNGLGLSLVTAIASVHGGTLVLEDAAPGLLARLELPLARDESFQTVS